MIRVCFSRKYRSFSVGEIAGFSEEEANILIEKGYASPVLERTGVIKAPTGLKAKKKVIRQTRGINVYK